MNKTIVVVDDSEYKASASIEALEKIYEDPTFHTFTCLNDALCYLHDNAHITDLIVLDWCFPQLDGEMPEIDMGDKLLKWMKRRKMNVETIICSSDTVELEEEYENVIGTIRYSPVVSMESRYREIFESKNSIEKCLEKNMTLRYKDHYLGRNKMPR